MSMVGSSQGVPGTMDIGFEVSFESVFKVYSSKGPGRFKKQSIDVV